MRNLIIYLVVPQIKYNNYVPCYLIDSSFFGYSTNYMHRSGYSYVEENLCYLCSLVFCIISVCFQQQLVAVGT